MMRRRGKYYDQYLISPPKGVACERINLLEDSRQSAIQKVSNKIKAPKQSEAPKQIEYEGLLPISFEFDDNYKASKKPGRL